MNMEEFSKMSKEEIDEKIKDLDQQIEKLEREPDVQKKLKHKKLPSQYKEAVAEIKKMVKKINGIEDLKEFNKENEQLFRNMFLTIASYFHYLKEEKADSREYEEAKEAIMSIGEKHKKLDEWCKELVDSPLLEKKSIIGLFNVELNVDESCEYVVNEDLKIVFDSEEVKDYANKTEIIGENQNSAALNYKIIYKQKEYNCRCCYDGYKVKWEFDEECPFRVPIIIAKKDENENYIVVFNIFEPYKI